jgi:2-polyprenyl-6-methoxyphenol hydroxylase-like FAD-dependent oxidoreductase
MARFGAWHDPIPALIEATAEERVLRNEIYDRAPAKRWGRGRVTLLGDAAHPMAPDLGQGACMAIEDAWSLALRVRETRGDVASALREYERKRRKRTASMVRQSRLYGWAGQWERPWLTRLREMVVGMIPAPMMARGVAALGRYQVE